MQSTLMLENDNIWQEKFNEESLDSEAWLTPNANLFDSITHSIEIANKKKKRKWIILFFIIGLMPLLLLLLPSNPNRSGAINSTDDLITELDSPSVDKEKQEFVNNSETSIIADLKNIEPVTINDNSKITNSTPPNSNNSNGVNDKVQKNENLIIGIDNNQENLEDTNESYSNNEHQISHELSLNKRTKSNPSSELRVLKQLLPIKRIDFLPLPVVQIPLINLPDNKTIGVAPTPFKRKKVQVGFTSEFWNFNLNNNYVTALNPADFNHGNGIGYSAFINFSQSITKKLYFNYGVALQQITFESGHNSSIAYDLSNEAENGMSNQFDLTMASPLGFLNSEVLIQRQSIANDAITDLAIDLNNEHSLTTIDLFVGLNYKVLNYRKLSLGLGIKGGINQLLRINNKLASVNTNHSNFLSESTIITKDQNSIKNLTPYFGSSMNLEFNIDDNNGIGITASLSNSLNPIYQEGDFSTNVIRHNIGMYWSTSF
ncbi:MAG: hypothetical protein HKO66_00775 [Saprospiraceae bacterium]|nr:hypothetical protein [Saprospiraceae bacterium]